MSVSSLQLSLILWLCRLVLAVECSLGDTYSLSRLGCYAVTAISASLIKGENWGKMHIMVGLQFVVFVDGRYLTL